MEKSALRAKMLHELKTFPDKERESRVICDSLQSLSIYREAETILAFSPLSTEPDISPLFSDERILFPFITGNGEMEYGRGKLVKNRLGFLEPEDKIAIEYHRAIILVPLLALDKHLYRLGRGKGFYDNYLKKNGKKLFSIALAFSPSLTDEIERDMWDEKLDMAIVGGTIKCPQLNAGDRI